MSDGSSSLTRAAVRDAFTLRPSAMRLGALALAGGPLVAGLSALVTGWNAGTMAIVLAIYLAGALLAVVQMQRSYPHEAMGLCNIVTLLRWMLVATLCAPLSGDADPHFALGIAVIVLALDGLDGWLARRQGVASRFGARFDMEVDSAFALILALNIWAFGHMGAVVLILGLPRYAFVVATWVWPWLGQPVPDRFSRKLACVLQISALIALLSPLIAQAAAIPVVSAVLAILGLSFAQDIMWLRRRKRGTDTKSEA